MADELVIVSAEDTLPDSPVNWAVVTSWAGRKLQFDLELWANAAVTGTGLQLRGAVPRAMVLADDTVDDVDATANTLEVTGHAYEHGDGPLQLDGDDLPGGTAELTDYWFGVDGDLLTLYLTLEDFLNQENAVDITSAGSGTITIIDTDDTKRLRWLSMGYLGHNADGAVSLTAVGGYCTRVDHRRRVLAYAVCGSASADLSASIFLVENF